MLGHEPPIHFRSTTVGPTPGTDLVPAEQLAAGPAAEDEDIMSTSHGRSSSKGQPAERLADRLSRTGYTQSRSLSP